MTVGILMDRKNIRKHEFEVKFEYDIPIFWGKRRNKTETFKARGIFPIQLRG